MKTAMAAMLVAAILANGCRTVYISSSGEEVVGWSAGSVGRVIQAREEAKDLNRTEQVRAGWHGAVVAGAGQADVQKTLRGDGGWQTSQNGFRQGGWNRSRGSFRQSGWFRRTDLQEGLVTNNSPNPCILRLEDQDGNVVCQQSFGPRDVRPMTVPPGDYTAVTVDSDGRESRRRWFRIDNMKEDNHVKDQSTGRDYWCDWSGMTR